MGYRLVGVIAGFTKDGETTISGIASILKKILKITNYTVNKFTA